ncbi:hypothetical protein [Clostridium algidicarnis]|uniref:Uncharacterized protein n=2 Tax=Clostridium algidicarnis TaxID=37659 RepID=A0A2S6FV01_9CLOT|nr:hypothetical protein [Clostridium algidicarnis]MBU3220913.1 hypothetical protein [Clostridium algidicarnis]PPK44162.1 hypothetical protein BD821_12429 [Clostridium algidicarnis DSM 15099]
MPESKHDKFLRIAEARTNKIIDMIRLLSNCSNEATYEYDETDVKEIFSALEQELKSCKGKFQDLGEKNNKFTLRREE